MELINISINPSYFCNFRCPFCYLSKDSLGDSGKISPEALFSRLSEISAFRRIDRIDLYGGEIGLLRPDYFKSLKDVIRLFFKGEISLISNLSVVPDFFREDDIDLSVSWDFFAREKHEVVFKNMQNLKKPFHILVLASATLVEMTDGDLSDFIFKLNSLNALASVEIKPFSHSLHNNHGVQHADFEIFVRRFFQFKDSFRFEFINEKKIVNSLSGKTNAWSDDHLYITPKGNWAVLDFDEINREYFKELKDFDEYLVWAETEKSVIKNNFYCGSCKYLGRCLSEHLQVVKEEHSGCNGFRGLLDWYENDYFLNNHGIKSR